MLRTVPTQFINQVQPLDTWPDLQGSPDEAGCPGSAPHRWPTANLLRRGQLDSRGLASSSGRNRQPNGQREPIAVPDPADDSGVTVAVLEASAPVLRRQPLARPSG